MNCPKCGNFAPKTAIKCPACGNAMKQAAPPPPAARPRPKPAGPNADLVKAALADRDTKQAAGPKPPSGPPRAAAKPPAGPPALGPDGKPLPPEEQPVTYTAPAAVRDKNLGRRLARDTGVAAAVVAVVAAAFFSPPGQAAYASWLVRRAADNLGYTPVGGQEIMAGSVQIKLPDGSTSAMDEKSHHQVYHFDKSLDLGNGKQAHVAFDLTGYPAGIDDALDRGAKLQSGLAIANETHNYKKFRTVQYKLPDAETQDHPGQRACYYQFADRDENFFSIVLYYDEAATDKKAMAAVIDHVLGSIQE